MVSDKFVKRFNEVKNKYDDDNDIRITKRYIDEKDIVFNFPNYIDDNLDDWKCIIIEFETTITNIHIEDYALKLAFVLYKDQHGNVITGFKKNKALTELDANTKNFMYKIGYTNNICFNTVVTAVNVSKNKEYQKELW